MSDATRPAGRPAGTPPEAGRRPARRDVVPATPKCAACGHDQRVYAFVDGATFGICDSIGCCRRGLAFVVETPREAPPQEAAPPPSGPQAGFDHRYSDGGDSPPDWRCDAQRSHGRCGCVNGADDETCGACGAARPCRMCDGRGRLPGMGQYIACPQCREAKPSADAQPAADPLAPRALVDARPADATPSLTDALAQVRHARTFYPWSEGAGAEWFVGRVPLKALDQILAAVERLQQDLGASREFAASCQRQNYEYLRLIDEGDAERERLAHEAANRKVERDLWRDVAYAGFSDPSIGEIIERLTRERDEARREATASRRWARAWKTLAHSHRVATRLWRALAQRDLPDPDVAARRHQARALRAAVLAEARRRTGAERPTPAAEPTGADSATSATES